MRRLPAILSIAVNDLRLTTKERSALFWMLIMPVAFIGLIGGAFGGEDRTPPTGLAVIDLDASFLSRSFADQLGQEKLKVGVFPAEKADSASAYSRTLTIPKGFSDSLAAGKRVALTLDVARSKDADRDLTARISIYKVIVRTLAALAEADTAGTGAITGASFEEQYRLLLSRPDLIRTEVSAAGKGRILPSGVGASAPAMLVMFLMVNTVIYGSIFLALEKQNRCLARMGTMPVNRGDILAGKVIGRVMIGLVQSAIMVLAGTLIYKVWWGPSPVALLALLVCLAITSAALGILMGGLVRTPEQAGAIAWIVPLFLGAIGGCWWPLEVVPRWMQVVGHISPAAWAMDAMHGMLSFGRGPEAILVPCLVLMGMAGVLLVVGARSLKTD